jgi:hypothetical protein
MAWASTCSPVKAYRNDRETPGNASKMICMTSICLRSGLCTFPAQLLLMAGRIIPPVFVFCQTLQGTLRNDCWRWTPDFETRAGTLRVIHEQLSYSILSSTSGTNSVKSCTLIVCMVVCGTIPCRTLSDSKMRQSGCEQQKVLLFKREEERQRERGSFSYRAACQAI